MSPLQIAVYSALAGFPGLAALAANRIFPDVAPQDCVRPFVVWQEISVTQMNSIDGSAESNGLHNCRVQVTFWDRDQTKCREGDRQVRLAMIAAAQASPMLFRSLHVDCRAMQYEPDTKLYGTQSDFSVWLKT